MSHEALQNQLTFTITGPMSKADHKKTGAAHLELIDFIEGIDGVQRCSASVQIGGVNRIVHVPILLEPERSVSDELVRAVKKILDGFTNDPRWFSSKGWVSRVS